MSAPCLGLDLGNTSGSCAVFRQGGIDVVPNEQGSRTTPAVIAFTDVETLLGEPAKAQVVRNAANTVIEGLRLLGREFDDDAFQEEIGKWRFRVSRGKDGIAPFECVWEQLGAVQGDCRCRHCSSRTSLQILV